MHWTFNVPPLVLEDRSETKDAKKCTLVCLSSQWDSFPIGQEMVLEDEPIYTEFHVDNDCEQRKFLSWQSKQFLLCHDQVHMCRKHACIIVVYYSF